MTKKIDYTQSILESIPDFVFITDKNHFFIGGNEKAARVIGFNSLDSMLGTKFEDMPCDAKLCAKELIWQRDHVMNEQKTIDVLDIHPYDKGEILTKYAKKHPLYVNNTIVGVTVVSRLITNNSLKMLLSALVNTDASYHKSNDLNRSYTFTNNINDLTKRETECFFYVLRGYTSKVIGNILCIDKRTVESHIESIKRKMQCRTKSELIEIGILSGMIYKIPSKLITNNFTMIL